MFFSHVYSPRQGQTTHWGQKFYDTFLFAHMLQVSNKSLWILILNTFFNVFPHVYSPGRGQTTFVDKILMSTEKPCHFAHLLQVSKIYLWNLIIYIIFHAFIHVYSSEAGEDDPLGSEFLYKHKPFVTMAICCKFLPLNDFLTVFPI